MATAPGFALAAADELVAVTVSLPADLIVTGDHKHRLPLGPDDGIPNRSPADFLRSLAANPGTKEPT